MTWAPSWYKEPTTPKARLADKWWRLNNLYTVVNEHAEMLPFQPRAVQADYYWRQWYLDLILKSRQHGFTTFIGLDALDSCIWTNNYRAHLIAHTREDSERLFEDKISKPLEKMTERYPTLKGVADTDEDNARVLSFPNGSVLSCGTSMRGGTLNMLHISEHGKICAAFPAKAKEIRSGALNTVHEGNRIVIESTAEGREGDFYEFAELARKLHEAKAKLSRLQWRFHFYAWWRDSKNATNPAGIVITDEHRRYFDELAKKHGIRLTPGQRAWYVVKSATQRDLMYREHPSTAAEAFQGAVEGTYYGREMLAARRQGRIAASLPWETKIPVETSWDLGKNNRTAVWWWQYDRFTGMHRALRYEEQIGHGLAYWWGRLIEVQREFDITYGRHFLPHDIGISDLTQDIGRTREDFLYDLGMRNIVVVPRVHQLEDGIDATRGLMPSVIFSEAGCSKGITRLETYRVAWDDAKDAPRDTPLKDGNDDGADAFRQYAQGWHPVLGKRSKERKRSWRTA